MVELLNRKTAFHIHTRYSYDSNSEPKDIVDYLVKRNYEQVIITDHDCIDGALIARDYAETKYGDRFKVIIGEEMSTKIGDIIGFPLTKCIISNYVEDCFEKIKDQNALVCLPHPYKEHDLFEIHKPFILSNIDFVEVFNARLNPKLNEYANKYAKYFDKKNIVGSDAHLIKELDNTSFSFTENLKSINISKETYSLKRNIRRSQLIKYYKMNNYSACLKYFILEQLNM